MYLLLKLQATSKSGITCSGTDVHRISVQLDTVNPFPLDS